MANDNNKKKYIKYEDTTYILEDSRIPDPTSDDNGKVLGVVNGAYALKQEEGGSGAVTSVNGKTGAVSLSASDVGALPDNTVIPTVPQMATDPDMADWTSGKTVDAAVLATDLESVGRVLSAKYTKPSGGIPASDLAAGVIPDISGKANAADVAALVSRLNAIADSDDTTLDQLSEIVAYIKNNKSLIDNITTGKVSVSDIVDNLTSSATNKPLSANQGRALKALIDAIVVPTESTVSGWGFTKNTGTYSKPSGGIPKTDLASDVQTSLGKADTALQPAALQAALDDNVPPVQFVLVMNGNTLSTVDAFVDIAFSLSYKPRRIMFVIVVSQSGGTVTSALELYPTMIDTNSRALTLAGYFDGSRYTAELTAASVSSTMTGTLVAKPIVTVSDIPAASTAAPLMDGTAAVGTTTAYARADHIHPSDTTRLSTTGNAYRTASIPMGHLDATSTATVMTATVDGITELRDGVCMWLRNGVITSASGFTLNVNGLGAKPCYSSLAAASRSTTIFNANYTMLLIYNSTRVDGGCWDIVYGVDTNTTYTPVKLGFGYGTCTTAAATAAKTASISSYALNTGGIVSIKFDNDVPAGATLNITSKGAKAIYHRGAAIAAGVIKAGDTATFVYSTYYHLIAIDRDESGDDLPSVTASDNGKVLGVVNGAWGLKDDETGGGGGGTSPTLLGTTPLKLTADADNLILSGSGEISYALQSDTVADFPVLSGTANNASVTQENGVFVLTCGSGASAWYQSYLDITVSGLVVNQSYNFVFDAAGCEYNETAHKTVGHYILYDGSGNTLVTRGATDTNKLSSYSFTAPTTSVRVRWYPATNNTFSSGVSVATVNAIYINRTGTTEHTAILDVSGTFTDSTTIPGVPAGTAVTSTPSCSVYSKASESGGAALPLEGKTIVCFGDSLFGLYRGSTSAPAYVEKVTGATVYNVGFGGCRMSDHPSHGYAEFSMWALAHAIATDTWTDQDTYVSQGSDYFPEQLATLKGIDFSTVDYAVIHYGTNDFGGGVAIGADSVATVHNTLCGALRYSIETLLTAYPKLRIFVSLPCFRFWTVDGQTVYSDTYTNSQNKTLVEYVAALRAVAGEYNIPVIENYTGNGINKVNASTFLGDGTHHNADGRERFGTFIAENLISGGSSGIAAAESNSFGGGS